MVSTVVKEQKRIKRLRIIYVGKKFENKIWIYAKRTGLSPPQAPLGHCPKKGYFWGI